MGGLVLILSIVIVFANLSLSATQQATLTSGNHIINKHLGSKYFLLWGDVCPVRYFSFNYPDFSPRFTLSWISPPSRPRCIAHLPYKARCIIKQ